MSEIAKYVGLALVLILSVAGGLILIGITRDFLTTAIVVDSTFIPTAKLIAYSTVIAIGFCVGATGWASWSFFSREDE